MRSETSWHMFVPFDNTISAYTFLRMQTSHSVWKGVTCIPLAESLAGTTLPRTGSVLAPTVIISPSGSTLSLIPLAENLAGTTLPRTEAFRANSQDIPVWELVGRDRGPKQCCNVAKFLFASHSFHKPGGRALSRTDGPTRAAKEPVVDDVSGTGETHEQFEVVLGT